MYRLIWVPFWTLFVKEIRRFTSILGQTVITPVISAFLYMIIFGLSLDGTPYLSFLIPGLITMAIIGNACNNPMISLAISKFHGELEALKISPLSVSQIVWAMSLAGLARGVVVGGSVFIVGTILEGAIHIAYPLLVLYFLCVAGLTFAQLGVIIGFQARKFDHINIFDTFILVPLMFLGGVFFSLDRLHPFWKMVSGFNPLLYFINGMRYSFLGISDISIGLCVIVTAVVLIAVHLLAHLAVKRGSFHRW